MTGPVSKPVELVFTRDNTRRYIIWKGEIDGEPIVTHGFGALFPERYLPSRSAETSIWHCPVQTCGQACATPPDLGNHFVRFHAGAILHDHLDGTFSVIPQDPESAYDANRQPYVASQGHRLPSPSLRRPSHFVSLQSGPGAPDTPAVAVHRHDKSKPQSGNRAPSSSSEANSDDESDDNESDGSDADQSGTDDSDGSDDSESNGGDTDEAEDEVGHKKANETKLQSNDTLEASSDDSDTSDNESSGSKTDQQDVDKPARANIKAATDRLSSVGIKKEDTDRSPPATLPTPAAEDGKERTNPSDCKYANSEVWKYITSFTADYIPVPADPCLLELLTLPRQRDLPYCWKNWLNSRKPSLKTLTAVALYLSGAQRNTPCGDIMRCADFRDLYDELYYYGDKNAPDFHPEFAFDTCIQLPDYLREISPALEERFRGYYCCNAFYRHTKELPMPGAFIESSTQPLIDLSKKRKTDDHTVDPEPKKAKLEHTSGSRASRASFHRERQQQEDYRLSDNLEQPAVWETSSGTLPFVEQGASSKPGLAYSSNFLLKKRRVADYDTTFQLVKVPSTDDGRYFQANSDRFLLFAVKDGIVDVQVSGEKNFTIWAGGCWNLKPGQHCVIRNQSDFSEASVFVMNRNTLRTRSARWR